MANLSKARRDRMIAKLEELKQQHNDDASIAALNEIENALREKKYGLVWEEHSEAVDEMLKENIPVLIEDPERRLCKDESLPWNFIIEGDNLQALYLLEKTHRGKVDCIYIDPPYNSGAKDWKYNNDYVGKEDTYRHSKWLSMMKNRLIAAKRLLNPRDSVLICTIDEKEYAHLGCLLEELFPDASIQMISSVINPKGSARNGFSRSDEYIYFVMLGSCIPVRLPLGNEWSASATVSLQIEDNQATLGEEPGWTSMMRRGTDSLRTDSPNLYYPIYANPITKKIEYIGETIPEEFDRAEDIEGLVQILPLRRNGDQGRWQVSNTELKSRIAQGRIRLGKETLYGYVVNYLSDGEYKKIQEGLYDIDGYADDGSIIAHKVSTENTLRMPPTQWRIAAHNASENGTTMLTNIIGEKRFSFPKSLYAVYDTIRFFVANKPNAVIIDFFAGSGTTMHAVHLINAEDGGKRSCILVTNNEISETERQDFEARGICKGDKEWEEHGIAKYVTWPRIVCAISGTTIYGTPLQGAYGIQYDSYVKGGKEGQENCYIKKKTEAYPGLSKLKMSDGFKANVKYFNCGWTPRKPDDYLLSNALCLHVKELIELQTAREVDGVKIVLILSKSDYWRVFENPDSEAAVESVWVNENLIFNAAEMRKLKAKHFRYIPREYFSQELKEVGEYV